MSRANPVHVRSPAVVDDWHDGMVESLVRHRADARQAALSGGSVGIRFELMNEREVDDYFLAQRSNLDRLTVVDLVSAGEAAVRMDYDRRLLQKRKDPLSDAYRLFHRKLKNRSKDRPPFDGQGILTILGRYIDTNAARPVADYRQCLMARHWVAHGRYGDVPLGAALTVFETRRRVEALINALPA
jgi:hypothetical protein